MILQSSTAIIRFSSTSPVSRSISTTARCVPKAGEVGGVGRACLQAGLDLLGQLVHLEVGRLGHLLDGQAAVRGPLHVQLALV